MSLHGILGKNKLSCMCDYSMCIKFQATVKVSLNNAPLKKD
uniref:Uncharacterized protein n=1 Tax=Lepeophtheirus salmonis TaxID=72036 RepID=A0A0K2TKM3_LEPSM